MYKLAEIERDGKPIPRLKKSDSIEKITNPGFKTVYRIYEKESGKAFADLIALRNEKIGKPLTLTHETERWKKTVLEDYNIKELLVKVIENGKPVYECPTLKESSDYRRNELGEFWDEYKRLINPHIYKVDLSDGLYELKQRMLLGEGRN